jgi:hypothetical protein
MFSKTIVEELNKIATSPWAGWHHGKGFQQADLARELKAFEVTPETVRIGSETAKGYYAAKLASAFETYLPAAPISSSRPDLGFSAVTASQPNNDGHNLNKRPPSHFGGVTAAETQRNPDAMGIVTGVTAPEGKPEGEKSFDTPTDDPGDIPEFLRRSPAEPGPRTNACAGGNGATAHARPGNVGELGLDQCDIEWLARRYQKLADAQRKGGCKVDQEKLDAWLRRKLAQHALPEHVETEFEGVMQIVFGQEGK